VNPDPDGLLSILERHGPELHALLTRLTLRADVAEDLLQDLFLKLRSSASFARAANRRGYVFRAAVNLAFDWRRVRRPTETLTNESAVAADPPVERLIDAEELEQVLDAMNALSPLMREVVVLRFLQHLDNVEIAELLGKTEHQVRGLCHKALERLRAAVLPADEMHKRGSNP
jgi:RNA polymerase sigma factor (sigma-70 family)